MVPDGSIHDTTKMFEAVNHEVSARMHAPAKLRDIQVGSQEVPMEKFDPSTSTVSEAAVRNEFSYQIFGEPPRELATMSVMIEAADPDEVDLKHKQTLQSY